jgi:diguanylate cyclase (GGDEF)-like protein/PAS domain S-box-containing protein
MNKSIFPQYKTLHSPLKKAINVGEKNKILVENILNEANEYIYYKDMKLRYLGCNKAYASFIEKNQNEIIGKKNEEILNGYCLKFLEKIDNEVLKNKKKCVCEKWFCKSSGKKEYLHIESFPFKNEKGEIAGICGIITDLTSKKRTEDSLKNTIGDLMTKYKKFKALSTKDPLTHIYNRAKFNTALRSEIERAQRYNYKLSLILFDIDNFKPINDSHGHLTGDEILCDLTQLIKKNIRNCDTFARYGGDEFVIIAPEVDIYGIWVIAEKLRRIIELYNFKKVKKVTCSFGIAQYIKNEGSKNFIKRADEALYRAKNRKKNGVSL